jgi:hypothetical protein
VATERERPTASVARAEGTNQNSPEDAGDGAGGSQSHVSARQGDEGHADAGCQGGAGLIERDVGACATRRSGQAVPAAARLAKRTVCRRLDPSLEVIVTKSFLIRASLDPSSPSHLGADRCQRKRFRARVSRCNAPRLGSEPIVRSRPYCW